jgi:predicted DsbA family dithiol-disulfide isomerase
MGACTGCSYNTATLKTLFPEYAKHAVCNNKACYQQKCMASLVVGLTTAFLEHQPEALLFYGEPSELLEEILLKIPAAATLPRHQYYEVRGIEEPEAPDPEDYTDDEGGPDHEQYESALEEYQTELEEYTTDLDAGKYRKGLLVTVKSVQVFMFTLDKEVRASQIAVQVTAKQVQEALKRGTATPELLQAEINRMEEREKRSQEIDRDKIQLAIHEQFTDVLGKGFQDIALTPADQLAARLIIYQALDYSSRHTIKEVLFPLPDTYEDVELDILKSLEGLTDQQFSYLIRMVIIGKSESKYPRQDAAKVLYTVAESAGINIAAIEYQFEQKATDRQVKKAQKINVLEKKITSLTTSK